MDFTTVATLLAIGLCAGFFSGLVGIGGGIVIVPALVFILGMNQKLAQGTSTALFMIPLTFALSAYNYNKNGNINWSYAFIMMVTFLAGSYVGSLWANKIDPIVLRKVFAGFLVLIAIKLFTGK